MRNVTQQTMYFVDNKSFDSFTKAKSYALEMDLTEIVGVELQQHATTSEIVEFLFDNATEIKDILRDYCTFFQAGNGTDEPEALPSEDPVSP